MLTCVHLTWWRSIKEDKPESPGLHFRGVNKCLFEERWPLATQNCFNRSYKTPCLWKIMDYPSSYLEPLNWKRNILKPRCVAHSLFQTSENTTQERKSTQKYLAKREGLYNASTAPSQAKSRATLAASLALEIPWNLNGCSLPSFQSISLEVNKLHSTPLWRRQNKKFSKKAKGQPHTHLPCT